MTEQVKEMNRNDETNVMMKKKIPEHFGDILGGTTSFSPLPKIFTSLERIVLLANGNLQRIVSAFYNAEVSVRIKKNERIGRGTYDREVDLICFDRVFCTAKSVVTVTDEQMLAAIDRYVERNQTEFSPICKVSA